MPSIYRFSEIKTKLKSRNTLLGINIEETLNLIKSSCEKGLVFWPNSLLDGNEITLYGTLLNGAKIEVVVDKLPMFFDILVDSKIPGVTDLLYEGEKEDFELNMKIDNHIKSLINLDDAQKVDEFIRKIRELFLTVEHPETDTIYIGNLKSFCSAYSISGDMLVSILQQMYDDEIDHERKNGHIIACCDTIIAKLKADADNPLWVSELDIYTGKQMDENSFTIENVYSRPMNKFTNYRNVLFKRLHFTTTKARKNAILLCDSLNTYSNDLSSVYRKIAREEKMCLSKRVLLVDYAVNEIKDELNPQIIASITVACANVKELTDQQINNAEDKSTLGAWDIETYSTKGDDHFADPTLGSDNIFNIGYSYHLKDNPGVLYQVSIIDVDYKDCGAEVDLPGNVDIIICNSYIEVIKAFAYVLRETCPDFIVGFNDSQFDWKFVVYKAYYYGLLPWFINTVNPRPSYQLNTMHESTSRLMAILMEKDIDIPTYIEYYTYYLHGKPLTYHAGMEFPEITDEENDVLFGKFGELTTIMRKYNLTERVFEELLKFVRMKRITDKTMFKGLVTTKNVILHKCLTIESEDFDIIVKKHASIDGMKKIFGFMNKGIAKDLAKNYSQYRQNVRIKITAEDTFISSFLNIDGCISIDTRVCYMKLYPKNETGGKSSLNSFLQIMRLESKEDMPYTHMFKIYREAKSVKSVRTFSDEELNKNIGLIIKYCLVDALRCQQLLVKSGVIMSYQELSALTYVSTQDSYLNAGGMKVRNLAAMYSYSNNILFNMLPSKGPHSKAKYPGAYVVDPIKRLVPDPYRCKKLKEKKEEIEQELESSFDTESKSAVDVEEQKHIKVAIACEQMKVLCKNSGFAVALAKYEELKKFLGTMPLHMDRPICGLDFNSLYPSLMMAYNFSPDTMILTKEELAKYKDVPGFKVHHVQFTYDGKEHEAWAVFHHNDKSKIGIFPTILIDLMAKRNQIKKLLSGYKKSIELMDLFKSEGLASESGGIFEAMANHRAHGKSHPIIEKFMDENPAASNEAILEFMSDMLVQAKTLDIKQNAVKIIMNTFYGEAGNNKSPMFLLELAVGITSAGRDNIKAVKNYVETVHQYFVTYGDTDSLYLSAPNHFFEEVDIRYLTDKNYSKKDYWHDQVAITMEQIAILRDAVNKFLEDRNGTKYLKMAFEEVLFPALFTGKKKYLGSPHEEEINFDVKKKAFIRGIDIIKQGMSPLVKYIGNEIIRNCRSIDNYKSVREIVFDVIRESVKREWDYDDFVLSASYKPAKKNVTVQTFVTDMQLRGMPTPNPGERFKYIIVKRDAKLNLDNIGRIDRLNKGHRIEYEWYVKEQKLPVDKMAYFTGSAIGICARFINFDPKYSAAAAAAATAATTQAAQATQTAEAEDEAFDNDNDKEELIVTDPSTKNPGNDQIISDPADGEDDVFAQKEAKKDLTAFINSVSDNEVSLSDISKEVKEKVRRALVLAQEKIRTDLPAGLVEELFTKVKMEKNESNFGYYYAMSLNDKYINKSRYQDAFESSGEKIVEYCREIDKFVTEYSK